MERKKMFPMMCPMMGKMNMGMMPMGMDMDMSPMDGDMYDDEDERDEDYFMGMYPDTGSRMMPYVTDALDRMEEKNDNMYDDYPDGKMLNSMSDRAYDGMVKEMPDMADDEEERQFGRRRFGRDLFRILFLNALLRRRRRRRRHDHFGMGFGGY